MAEPARSTATSEASVGAAEEGPNEILKLWRRLGVFPGGRGLFSWLLRFRVPYTATIGPRILELEPGFARVALRERRRVRNHLRSVHAVALVNLAECATGLAMLAGMPDQARAILVGLSMEYTKKARGRLVAECRCPVVDGSERRELSLHGEIRDEAGDAVATAEARWLVGPKQ